MFDIEKYTQIRYLFLYVTKKNSRFLHSCSKNKDNYYVLWRK